MADLKTRFVQIVGTVASMSSMWKGPDGCGINPEAYHRGTFETGRSEDPKDAALHEMADRPADNDTRWPTKCDSCGAEPAADADVIHTRSVGGFYNTATEKPEPGDLFYADWMNCVERGKCHYKWSNCDGRHLYAVLPNGSHWDIDSRANNCTLPQDTTHRCWVRHGEVPEIHVDKQGHTCAAGAGSIVYGDYHGFLHNGFFTSC